MLHSWIECKGTNFETNRCMIFHESNEKPYLCNAIFTQVCHDDREKQDKVHTLSSAKEKQNGRRAVRG